MSAPAAGADGFTPGGSPAEAGGPDPGAPADPAGPDPGALAKAALRRRYRRWRREQLAAEAVRIAGDPCGLMAHPAPLAEAALLAAAQRVLPPLLPAGRRLAIWWPLPGEPDLRPLAAAGLLLALPVVEPASAAQPARMVYRPWHPGDPLIPDGCGIPAPLPAAGCLAPADLGLLLAPALAFDPVSGIRLGQGGGWYDRLRADPEWAAVPALAVLPAACLQRGLPQDPWDVPFRGWLDAAGLHGLEAM